MQESFLDTLVCQQCLGELALAEGKLVCNSCTMTYPMSRGLVFMGYDRTRKDEIEKIISTERDHQTDLNDMQKHYEFAYPSFNIGLRAIRILRNDFKEANPKAIDIGSGGSPNSQILSENGFDVYRCELDPNSLYYGLIWKHRGLGFGKHIVCDATILPFRDGSVDAVFSKEFVHHVSDYESLFQEISRVLKVGGILLMIDSTLSMIARLVAFYQRKEEHFGHHPQTMRRYFSALKMAGFQPYRYYLYHLYNLNKFVGPGRLKFLYKTLDLFHTQIDMMSKTSKIDVFFKLAVQRIIDGSHVVFLRKTENVSSPGERPQIQVVRPSNLVLDEDYLADARLEKYKEILNQVRDGLWQVA